MELGLIFALLSAVGFAASAVFVRKGVYQAGESFSAVPITIFVGTIFFSVSLLFTAGWSKVWSFSWQELVLLGAAGIMHFVIGRFLAYNCIRLIGANKSSPLLQTSPFYAVTSGILFLNEPLTIFLVLGVLCIVAGPTLVSIGKESGFSRIPGIAITSGLGAAFFWGISGVLVRPVVEEVGSPLAATFVSYVAASLIVAGILFCKGQREQLIQLRHTSITPLVISGLFVSVAQLLRYIALSYSPVGVVTSLIGTSGLFIFLFSFLLNRNIEVFTRKALAGIATTVIGTFLLFY